jgi:hypothetical protein
MSAMAPPRGLREPRRAQLLRDPRVLLAIVALAYAVVQLTLLGVHVFLGWDETIYTSQVIHHGPPMDFSAPRARGITLVVAPLALAGFSLTVLRLWLILLSALALFGAFWVWLRVLPGVRVPVAATMFAFLWATLFYGQAVMPNYWVAVGAVGAVGFLARALATPSRRNFIGVALCLGWTCLVRPSDGSVVAVGLAAVAAFSILRRHAATWVALGAGLLIGWVPWMVEAFVRFGGPLHRLHLASLNEQGGLTFSLGVQARSVVGPLLCRPCGPSHAFHPLGLVWWVVGAVLVVIGTVRARGTVERRATLMATVCGALLLAEYIFTIPYGAPRFLLPTYALLALPAATGLREVLRGLSRWSMPVPIATAAVLLGLAIQTISQVAVAHVIARDARQGRMVFTALATDVHRLDGPAKCAVIGPRQAVLAFAAGCEAISSTLVDKPLSPSSDLSRELADDTVIGVFRFRLPKGSPLLSWCEQTPPVEPGQRGWHLYIPPGRLSCR